MATSSKGQKQVLPKTVCHSTPGTGHGSLLSMTAMVPNDAEPSWHIWFLINPKRLTSPALLTEPHWLLVSAHIKFKSLMQSIYNLLELHINGLYPQSLTLSINQSPRSNVAWHCQLILGSTCRQFPNSWE